MGIPGEISNGTDSTKGNQTAFHTPKRQRAKVRLHESGRETPVHKMAVEIILGALITQR
jgi:hypothetical protein